MRFMVLLNAENAEAGSLPDEKVVAEMETHEAPTVWAPVRSVVGLALLLAFLVRFAPLPLLLMD